VPHATQRPQQLVVDRAEVAEVDPDAARGALADRLGHRVSLLVDLLEHECLEALLLGSVGVPVDLHHLAPNRDPARRHELHPARTQHHDLIVLDVLDVTGVAQEGGDRGGDELLAVAPPDDQRALLACSHDETGLVRGHRDERVVAAEVGVGATHRLDEVAVVVVRDEVGDHLGIGLGGEPGALVDQPALQRDVVLDDAIDHDVDAIGRVEVRVGVLLRDPPMGGPAGVADAGARLGPLDHGYRLAGAIGTAVSLDRASQRVQVAHRADCIDAVTVEHGDAGAVVAAIFELL
jgi:hypothetical protein